MAGPSTAGRFGEERQPLRGPALDVLTARRAKRQRSI